jgi:hypothetical protein
MKVATDKHKVSQVHEHCPLAACIFFSDCMQMQRNKFHAGGLLQQTPFLRRAPLFPSGLRFRAHQVLPELEGSLICCALLFF